MYIYVYIYIVRGEDKYQVGNLVRDNYPSMRVEGDL